MNGPDPEKKCIDWVGDSREVDLKLTVGELACLTDILNRQPSADRAKVYAAAAQLVAGKGSEAMVDFAGMLVRVNAALAVAEGMPTAFAASTAMVDQAKARLRDAA